MFLHILLVFVIQNGVFSSQKHNWTSLKQTSEFVKLINKVLDSEKHDDFYHIDLESRNLSLDSDVEDNDDKIKKKYDIKSENAISTNGVRLYRIQNPEVLFQYQQHIENRLRNVHQRLKKKSKAKYFDDFLSDLRRNAIYRLGKNSGEDNNLNEDLSLGRDKQTQSQRKQIEPYDQERTIQSDVAPLVFISEEPNRSFEHKKDKGDLSKWDEIKDPDYTNLKTKHSYEEIKKDKDFKRGKKKNSNKNVEDFDSPYTAILSKFNSKHKKEKAHKSDEIYKSKNEDSYKKDNSAYKSKGNDYPAYKPSNDYPAYKPSNDNYKPKRADNNYKTYGAKTYKRHENSNYYKPKKVERSGGGGYGRTPIPYIGRQSIYED